MWLHALPFNNYVTCGYTHCHLITLKNSENLHNRDGKRFTGAFDIIDYYGFFKNKKMDT